MDGQNERLGSLMAFSDIALILSTYGVLLAFNYIVEPVGINTWIVCTFFVGIKVLVVGIADITGIGKSAIISVIFVVIADAVILFINQLMAFGLSMRMLLIMTLVDIVVLTAAVLIWKFYANRELPAAEDEEDWVYAGAGAEALSGSQNVVPIDQNGLDELFSDQTVEVDSNEPQIAIDEESIIDESFFTESSAEGKEAEEDFTFSDVSETVQQEKDEELPKAEVEETGDLVLSFEEITQEIPTDEISAQIETKEADDFTTEGEEAKITEDETAQESIESSQIEVEPVIENEPEVIEAAPAIEEVTPSVVEAESSVEEVIPEETPIVETTTILSETQESVEERPEVIEEVEEAEPTILVQESEPQVEESVVETSEETPVQEREITSFIPETPVEPFGVLDLETYKRLTNREPKLSTTFVPLSTEVSQIEIDQYRTEVRHQTLLLDDQLNSLISAYNRAPSTHNSEKIDIDERVSVNHSLKEGDQIIRAKLKAMIDREFVSENILRSLIEMTNAINNRAYSLDVAEANLLQRKEREAQRRQQERKAEEEKLRAAREKQRKAQREARERELRERERQIQERRLEQESKQQSIEKKKIKTTPVLENNEVHLQNDDLDIIIDAADLELLREFLKQQDNQNLS